jgi:hypothetical protein
VRGVGGGGGVGGERVPGERGGVEGGVRVTPASNRQTVYAPGLCRKSLIHPALAYNWAVPVYNGCAGRREGETKGALSTELQRAIHEANVAAYRPLIVLHRAIKLQLAGEKVDILSITKNKLIRWDLRVRWVLTLVVSVRQRLLSTLNLSNCSFYMIMQEL